MEGHGGTLMKDARQEHPIAGMQVQQQPPATGAEESPEPPTPMWKIVLVSAIASGVQFGWALQLSLLTPYVQLLGIPHKWAGYIWLCGPISGMIVQPVVGHYSDHCTSRFGRRRPFIASGAALVACAVFLIGFAADIGHISGDHLGQVAKPRAIAIFVVGFWVLDVANNMLQGPIRAFMADLSGGSSRKTRMANAFYSFFMAVGNVLGYAAGSYNGLYKIFSFTQTRACDTYCANLKSCFLISIFLLLVVTILALIIVKEKVHSPDDVAEDDNVDAKSSTSSSCRIPFFGELWGALKELPRPMWILLLVTCLNWIGWFPFLLYDTDWMGREVYGGDNQGGPDHQRMYLLGVRQGSLGLMVNAVVLGFMSLAVEPMGRWLGGVKRLWGVVNFILAICLALTVLITKSAQANRQYTVAPDGGRLLAPPIPSVRIGALTLFAALGIPLAITFSIPFALASILSSTAGSGQGLSLGVLNLAIVFPQMFVSFASGPWDAIFGGGNLPAFVVGAIAAAASGLFALFLLPSPPPDIPQSKFTGAGGFH